MITITLKNEGKTLKQIIFHGHAMYDDYGKDIVCAGVSACVVGAMNALEDHKKFEFIMDDGHVLIKKIDDENLSIHNQIVLQTLLVQLKTIEESNKKFIKIN